MTLALRAGPTPNHLEHRLELLRRARLEVVGPGSIAPATQAAQVADDRIGEFRRRADDVGAAGGDRVARHAVVLLPAPERTITTPAEARSSPMDSNSASIGWLGARPPRIARDGHARAWWSDVDVVRLDRHAVTRLDHRHRGVSIEDLGGVARVAGVEMLGEYERGARIARVALEQLDQRIGGLGTEVQQTSGEVVTLRRPSGAGCWSKYSSTGASMVRADGWASQRKARWRCRRPAGSDESSTRPTRHEPRKTA